MSNASVLVKMKDEVHSNKIFKIRQQEDKRVSWPEFYGCDLIKLTGHFAILVDIRCDLKWTRSEEINSHRDH